jgi:hypothetical protein
MSSISEFTKDKISIIKSVAREHAINRPTNDTGMNIKITYNDIKEATGRKRIKQPIVDKVIDNFKNAGMEAKQSGDIINVYCPPLLKDKDEYTLKEIEERKSMIDDLNTIQAYKNQE